MEGEVVVARGLEEAGKGTGAEVTKRSTTCGQRSQAGRQETRPPEGS